MLNTARLHLDREVLQDKLCQIVDTFESKVQSPTCSIYNLFGDGPYINATYL